MKLTAMAATALGVDETTLSDSAEAPTALDWDDARHIDLLLSVEVACEVQFSIAEIHHMRTLDDMRALLAEKGAPGLAA